jgi:hypothetical protein
LRGIENVKKRYVIHAAARNLGTIMRALFGVGTPRAMRRGLCGLLKAGFVTLRLVHRRTHQWFAEIVGLFITADLSQRIGAIASFRLQITPSSTAC